MQRRTVKTFVKTTKASLIAPFLLPVASILGPDEPIKIILHVFSPYNHGNENREADSGRYGISR